jgi:hypothetical protein
MIKVDRLIKFFAVYTGTFAGTGAGKSNMKNSSLQATGAQAPATQKKNMGTTNTTKEQHVNKKDVKMSISNGRKDEIVNMSNVFQKSEEITIPVMNISGDQQDKRSQNYIAIEIYKTYLLNTVFVTFKCLSLLEEIKNENVKTPALNRTALHIILLLISVSLLNEVFDKTDVKEQMNGVREIFMGAFGNPGMEIKDSEKAKIKLKIAEIMKIIAEDKNIKLLINDEILSINVLLRESVYELIYELILAYYKILLTSTLTKMVATYTDQELGELQKKIKNSDNGNGSGAIKKITESQESSAGVIGNGDNNL